MGRTFRKLVPFCGEVSVRDSRSSREWTDSRFFSPARTLLSYLCLQPRGNMRIVATVIMIGLVAAPVAAQGRGRGRESGVAPGHLPPAGLCRVWYDGRPPGQQPRPTSCREAERVAGRDRYARVIYGDASRQGRDDRDWDRDADRGDPRDSPRAIPRRSPSDYPYPDRDRSNVPYPNRSGYPDERYPDRQGGYGFDTLAFDNGSKDGYDKGREDARDNDRYDVNRHSRYRSADRGYDRRYGSKADYQAAYREGFRAGYDRGYRDTTDYGSTRRRGSVLGIPW